jgi:multiple antibiotic resistance protein
LDVYTFSLFALSSLFAVIDPLGCIPFFSGLTSHMPGRQKRRILSKALLAAFFVLLVFIWLGHELLQLFGITIPAFRIAGGVILFGIGLDMLQSRPRRWRTGIRTAFAEDHPLREEEEEEDPSITPLAIPLIAGPGSITAVMVLVAESPASWGVWVVSVAALLILILTGGILVGADLVLRRMGQSGLKLMEKLMGLLVTVIAVQLVMNGVSTFVRKLMEG